MKKDSKFISRQEAAEILGVEPQTITNYVKKGYITSRTCGGVTYIDKDSFYKMKDSIQVHYANEQELERIIRLQEIKEKELQKEEEKTDELIGCLSEFRGALYSTLFSTLEVYCRRCDSERERFILRDIIEKDEKGYRKYKSMSSYVGLTAERIRQIALKGIRKAGEMMTAMDLELNEKTRRIEELEEQVELLKVNNTKLKSEVDSCKFDYKYKDEWLCTTSIENDDMLSVRAINVIRSHTDNVDMTMYELVQKPMWEISKWRNSGKKTLNEMIRLLDAHGYKFGMRRDELLVKVKKEEE